MSDPTTPSSRLAPPLYRAVFSRGPSQLADDHVLADAADSLLASMQIAGLVWGGEVLTGWRDDRYFAVVQLPAPDALEPGCRTPRVEGDLGRIAALDVSIEWKALSTGAGDTQWAWQPPALVFAHALSTQSPLQDLRRNLIPVYRLGISAPLRERLWRWMCTYVATDRVYLESGRLEMPAYEQLADPASELSVEGRGAARQVEEESGVECYYYLLRYWGRRATDQRPLCPGCGDAWTLWEEGHLVEVYCRPCRLASSHAVSFEHEERASIGEWKR